MQQAHPLVLIACCMGILAPVPQTLHSKPLRNYVVQDKQLSAQLKSLFGKAKTPEEALRSSNATYLKDDSQLVAEHSSLPGWVIKALPTKGSYKQSTLSDTLNVGRVRCAEHIRQLVQKHHLKHIVVPDKFLYQLPKTRGPINDRNTMVLAQKLDLVDEKQNLVLWRNLNVEQEDELLFIIDTLGFMDLTIPNVVFTTDGKMAFIDTEPRWRIEVMERIGPLRWIKRKILARRGRQKLSAALAEVRGEE